MAGRASNTMIEGLQQLVTNIAQLKTTPDADVQWLLELESLVLQKLREPVDAMAGQMTGPGGPDAQTADVATQVSRGPMPGIQLGVAPNSDEWSRMLR